MSPHAGYGNEDIYIYHRDRGGSKGGFRATEHDKREGFAINDLEATAREIQAWFFHDYVPAWVKAAIHKDGESLTFQYCSVPMYWNAFGVNDWLTTEAAVRQVIELQQREVQDQHYEDTDVSDRRIVAYNQNGGAVEVIWSRLRADQSEVMHLVPFEIARLKGKEWLTEKREIGRPT